MSRELSQKKATLTRKANNLAKGIGVVSRGRVFVESAFISYRIEDLSGEVTMKQASELHALLTPVINENFDVSRKLISPMYHNAGVVFTWICE